MARAQRRSRDGFTFGGRLPWAVGLVLSLALGLSLFAAFGSRHTAPLFELASLSPQDVWRGQVWRLADVAVPRGRARSALIFTCLFVYWFGRDLADEWGSPRFLRVFGGVMLAAAVATCLVAQIDRSVLTQSYLGGWSATTAMIVAWGLWFPDRVVRIYFVLPIRGYWLAWLTIAITFDLRGILRLGGLLAGLFAEGSIVAWLFRGSILARGSEGASDVHCAPALRSPCEATRAGGRSPEAHRVPRRRCAGSRRSGRLQDLFDLLSGDQIVAHSRACPARFRLRLQHIGSIFSHEEVIVPKISDVPRGHMPTSRDGVETKASLQKVAIRRSTWARRMRPATFAKRGAACCAIASVGSASSPYRPFCSVSRG